MVRKERGRKSKIYATTFVVEVCVAELGSIVELFFFIFRKRRKLAAKDKPVAFKSFLPVATEAKFLSVDDPLAASIRKVCYSKWQSNNLLRPSAMSRTSLESFAPRIVDCMETYELNHVIDTADNENVVDDGFVDVTPIVNLDVADDVGVDDDVNAADNVDAADYIDDNAVEDVADDGFMDGMIPSSQSHPMQVSVPLVMMTRGILLLASAR